MYNSSPAWTRAVHRPAVAESASFGRLSEVTALLRRAGFPEAGVGVRLNGDPDEDFAFLASARTFMCSGGGYSKLAAALHARAAAALLDAVPEGRACTHDACVSVINQGRAGG